MTQTDMTPVRTALKSQYHAALGMLRQTIEQCPDELWLSTEYKNAYWQVAYHVLYFAHVYLMPDQAAFQPWQGHQSEVQNPDGLARRVDPNSSLPPIPKPYTRSQVLAYWSICDGMVDSALDSLDLNSPDSGFIWYAMPKLEHQIVNIRHIEHHMAQLADRLRFAADTGTRWIGAGR